LHRAGQELNAIFHLQQAVEKTLKATVIKMTGTFPPRIHNLQGIIKHCGLQLTPEQSQLLEDLTKSYTDSRYPEQWADSPPAVSGERTERLIAASKDFIAWLRRKL
jgi:HEPN domain-containing protein